MKTTTELKEFAQLAQASYADLKHSSAYKDSDETEKRLMLSPNGGFADLQATDFTNRYHVLNQFRDEKTIASGGFSATVFVDRANSNRLVLGFAGTEFTTDLLRDGLLTDLQIGTVGYARPQAGATYRYIKQLKTAADVSVVYSEQELLNLFQLAGYTDTSDYAAFKLNVLKDKGITGGAGGAPLFRPGMEIDVAGHSLGGHLALLAQRLFPALFDDVITVNAVTFYGLPLGLANPLRPQTEGSLSLFGQWDNSKILRIESVGDGVSELGTLHPGQTLTVAMETQAGALAAFGPNHSVANVADGLALTELMGKLDARYMADPRVVKALFDGASNTPGASYEKLLDGLRQMIQGGTLLPTGLDNTAATQLSATRKSLYDNFKTLTDLSAFKALTGKATLSLANTSLSTTAKTDFGAFLALNALSPIVISTTDATALAALRTANASLATAWTADKNARLSGDTTKVFDYTDQWYRDRSAMLGVLIKRNEDDVEFEVLRGTGTPVKYNDRASNTTVDFGLGGPNVDKPLVVFGSNASEADITGGIRNDRLYGGAGDDTLEGKGGADYLEGGSGVDTYLLQTTGGIDTLHDSDGLGIIKVDGVEIKGAFSLVQGMGGNNYYSADKTAQLRPMPDGTWRLSVKDATSGQYSSAADLKGWKDGHYGLTLGADTAAPERVQLLFPGSAAYLNFNGASAPKGVYFAGGDRSDSFTGSAFSDVITTGGGLGHWVSTQGGDDLVVGGDGRDFIRTGGNGVSATVSDNDIAYGGENSDVLMGGAGDDQLWGDFDNGTNDTTAADSDTRGDWLSGEIGDDTLTGSRRSDVMFGGAGADLIKGGAGADLMLGDAQYAPFSRAVGLPYALGITQSFVWQDARGEMVRLSAGGYALDPIVVPSGNAFSWTWSPTASGDYTLQSPAGLVVERRVSSNGGADVMYGGAGNDWMAGQTGDDHLYGGDGDDILYGDDAVPLGAGNLDGNDHLFAGKGADTLHGGAGHDVLNAQDDDSSLDKLYGGSGDDFLEGGGKDGTLLGGAGDDAMWGDHAIDRLYGVAGLDGSEYVFCFTLSASRRPNATNHPIFLEAA